jgi:hypothetical protein
MRSLFCEVNEMGKVTEASALFDNLLKTWKKTELGFYNLLGSANKEETQPLVRLALKQTFKLTDKLEKFEKEQSLNLRTE